MISESTILSLLTTLGSTKTSVAGDWVRGTCPIHNGDGASFAISLSPPYKYFCYSHACHEASRRPYLLSLVKACLGYGDEKAAELLATYGIEVGECEEEGSDDNNRDWYYEFFNARPNKEVDYDLMRQVASEAYKNGCSYFVERGIRQETADMFKLGTHNNWKFRGETRATIPVFDIDKKLVGLMGRDINSNKHPTKYEWWASMKTDLIYNIHVLPKTIEEHGFIIITEGVHKVLHLWDLGYKNAVATFGARMSYSQARQLLRFFVPWFVIFDGDEAGHKGAKECAKKSMGLTDVYVPKKTPKDFDIGNADLNTVVDMLSNVKLM